MQCATEEHNVWLMAKKKSNLWEMTNKAKALTILNNSTNEWSKIKVMR
jgi:hypothetical protein